MYYQLNDQSSALSRQEGTPISNTPIVAQHQTQVVIAGAGPAGAVLALLLARQGIDVLLLESHRDFDRDFRGDTMHPMILEVLDEIGLAEKALQLEHARVEAFKIPGGLLEVPLREIPSKFPFMAVMPQARFLEFIVEEARRFPHFQLRLGAQVVELVEEAGTVHGLRYQAADGLHEVRATLTVGADGRFSKVRHLVGFTPEKLSAAIDVLWFRLPRQVGDSDVGLSARTASHHMLFTLPRPEAWQIAYVIGKGQFAALRAQGIDALQRSVAELMPEVADRTSTLQDWNQVAVLSVESSRLKRWHKPGLLLIGDAAHVMSPVGGVGINYAVQDAVVAANVLTTPLKAGRLTERHLAAVQRKRWWPTVAVQAFQTAAQHALLERALVADSFQLPWVARFAWFRRLVARFITLGLRRVHVQHRTPSA